METSEETDEAAELEGQAGLVHNKGDIPPYNKREMESQGNYILGQLLKSGYRQGWRFMTQCVYYFVSDASWEPEN